MKRPKMQKPLMSGQKVLLLSANIETRDEYPNIDPFSLDLTSCSVIASAVNHARWHRLSLSGGGAVWGDYDRRWIINPLDLDEERLLKEQFDSLIAKVQRARAREPKRRRT